ncbi:FecCD family ABC transporter permease [Actinomadura syzygii]|uniref:Iron ABC transporter permease n=1 Tax=Actinomadura syzygii TaxID=1427538 RepID=A0A5D0TQS5_9ACTN|nr:iron ABC transporter permease [Actinomadura syzygii]TYC07615.1 iron ABC transporter permease [Actinomadura syzygii]
MAVLDPPEAGPPEAGPPGTRPRETSAAAVALLLSRRRRAQARRAAVPAVLLSVLLVGLVAASLLLELRRVPLADVAPAALGLRDGLADYVIFRIRMPRVLAAGLAGALFGISGALYQGLIRNPLATPDIVGVSAGAGAGAITVLVLAPTLPYGTTLAALAGSFLAVGLIHALSWRGGVDTYRLVLVGIGLSAVCTAYTNYLFTIADEHSMDVAMRWLIGSTAGATWQGVRVLAVALAVCLVVARLLTRPLAGIALGDELATGLGTHVPRARMLTLLLGAAAAALATSVVGPIGFVALISGPIAARLAGGDRACALAPLVGAVIVVGADVLAQRAPLVSPVPTGVFTALLGAPYFVHLILRRPNGAPA